MNFAGMVARCLQPYAVSARPGCETWLLARTRDSLLLRAVNLPHESSSGMTKQARVSACAQPVSFKVRRRGLRSHFCSG